MLDRIVIKRVGALLIAAAALAALAVFVGPALSVSEKGITLASAPGSPPFGSLCWLYALTGVHCPMCGMLRSLIALLHGDLAASVTFHPAGPMMAGALVAALVAFLWRAKGGVARWLETGSIVAIIIGVIRWMI
ncbi:MAG TPA: DUF2752 domain-containing protein [Polyangia bacterium]